MLGGALGTGGEVTGYLGIPVSAGGLLGTGYGCWEALGVGGLWVLGCIGCWGGSDLPPPGGAVLIFEVELLKIERRPEL